MVRAALIGLLLAACPAAAQAAAERATVRVSLRVEPTCLVTANPGVTSSTPPVTVACATAPRPAADTPADRLPVPYVTRTVRRPGDTVVSIEF